MISLKSPRRQELFTAVNRLTWFETKINSLKAEREAEKVVGSGDRHCICCKRNTVLKVPRQWPFVLLLKEGWTQGKMSGSKEGKVTGSGLLEHAAQK